MEKSNEKKCLKIKLSQLILFLLFFCAIIGGICYFFVNNDTENNTRVTKLEKEISTLCLEYETKLADLKKQIKDHETKIANYETEIAELKEKNNELEEYKKENPVNINGFYTGYYSHECDIIIDNGESTEWSLPVGNGFEFKEDGSVLAFLPGHESGYFKGTYEISNNEIKCVFTVYENESSATYDSPVDEKSELTLKQINERQIQIKTWTNKPDFEDLNELLSENTVFTFYPI